MNFRSKHEDRRRGLHRRAFLGALSAGGVFFTQKGAFAQALVMTPEQTLGPYYPDRLPLDQDNDLLIINDNITPAVGTPAWIRGRVLDRNGSPVRGAVVEIWQADNFGSYIHSQGVLTGRRDGNFQGYGRFETSSSGEYLFRTIKPGLYPGRVRHVHYKVTLPDRSALVTQLYIEGETGNDGVLNGIRDAAQRASVIRPWAAVPGSAVGELAATFDIVAGFTPTTSTNTTRPTLVSMAGVVNGASLNSGAAGGSWISLFGEGLAPVTRTWTGADIVNGRLPESLDGVSVQVGGRPAAVYYVSPGQLNVLAPEVSSNGTVAVTVTNGNGTSASVNVAVSQFMPAFFQFPGEYVAAVRADGSLVAPEGQITGATTVSARPGDTVLLFGTGFGPTAPATSVLDAINEPVPTANTVRVRFDNVDALVTYSGLISPGLYQLNVQVPDLPDGDHALTAEVGGVRTSKIVKVHTRRVTTANSKSSFSSQHIGREKTGKPDILVLGSQELVDRLLGFMITV
jgi:protocatechuate 3,4-dioxygenase, beta subunit